MRSLSHGEFALLIGFACALVPGVLSIIALVLRDAWRDWRRMGEFKARDAWKGAWH